MDERDRAIVRQLYDLQIELYDHHNGQIDSLQRTADALERTSDSLHRASEAVQDGIIVLRKSHDTLGKMLKLVGELLSPH